MVAMVQGAVWTSLPMMASKRCFPVLVPRTSINGMDDCSEDSKRETNKAVKLQDRMQNWKCQRVREEREEICFE